MRNLWIVMFLASTLVCTSCSDKDARAYAQKLADVLAKYSTQIDAKLADEQARYVKEAKRSEATLEQDEAQRLADLRSSKSQEAATNLKAGTLRGSSFVGSLLTAYGTEDFNSTKALYEKSEDAYLAHLKGLADLSVEKAKIDALEQALKTLAKDPGFLANAQEAAQFATDLKDKVNLNTCAAALTSKAAADKKIADLTAAIADPTKAADKDANTAQLAIATADSAAAAKLANSTGKLKSDQSCQ